MKIVTEVPRRVREIENARITLADGCRLAARIWLPEDAEQDPGERPRLAVAHQRGAAQGRRSVTAGPDR